MNAPLTQDDALDLKAVSVAFTEANFGSAREVDLSSASREQIGRLVVEVATRSFGLVRPSTYLVRFPAHVTRALATKSMKLMQSGSRTLPIATQAGQIASHAFVVSTMASNVVGLIAVAWDILAIITAQKFLADIFKKLAAIEQNLTALLAKLDNRAFAEVLAESEVVQRLHEETCVGGLSPARAVEVASQLQASDTSLAKNQKAALFDVLSVLDRLEKLEPENRRTGSLEEREEAIASLTHEFQRLNALWLMSLHARYGGLMVALRLPSESQLHRRKVLEQLDAAVKEHEAVFRRARTLHLKQVAGLAPRNNSRKRLALVEQAKDALHASFDEHEQKTGELRQLTGQLSRAAAGAIVALEKDCTFVVTMGEGGQVSRVQSLDS